MPGANSRAVAWAWTTLTGVVAACGGVQRLPRNVEIEPRRGTPIPLQCQSPDPPAPAAVSAFPFDATWTREGVAFVNEHPLSVATVRARDVSPGWTNQQREVFPPRRPGAPPSPSLVPLGGDYWRDTRVHVAVVDGQPWVSSAFASSKNGTDPINRGNAGSGAMWRAVTLSRDYLRVSVGGDADSGVGIELLIEPGSESSQCGVAANEPKRVGPAGFEAYARAAVWRARTNPR